MIIFNFHDSDIGTSLGAARVRTKKIKMKRKMKATLILVSTYGLLMVIFITSFGESSQILMLEILLIFTF